MKLLEHQHARRPRTPNNIALFSLKTLTTPTLLNIKLAPDHVPATHVDRLEVTDTFLARPPIPLIIAFSHLIDRYTRLHKTLLLSYYFYNMFEQSQHR